LWRSRSRPTALSRGWWALNGRRWTAARAALAFLLLSVGFLHGYLTRSTGSFPDSAVRRLLEGRDATPAPARADQERPPSLDTARSSGELDERLEALLSLGYAAGYTPKRERTGVILHEAASASAGYNLLVSGHAPAAYLMDMSGRVVHRWEKAFGEVWPERSLKPAQARRTLFWKRVHLFPDGALIGMFEGLGLVKLDRNAKVLWRFSGPVHHDLEIDGEGNIFVLLRRARRVLRISRDEPILEDSLAILDSDGRQQDEISILEAFERSGYASLVKGAGGGDILHTNTVTLLDGRHESRAAAFGKGNLLMAVRNLDVVCILDPSNRQIVWAMTGMWVRPHEPVLLGNGHMLIFDNEGWARRGRKLSRVFEFDPLSQEVKWSYTGPPDFHSAICGLAQRLPNGNTLITVSTEGRVLEVTPEGQNVWEFLNPHATIVEGEERVATIFDMVRLPASRVAALLSGS
jgi:arylsulfotransferase ASST